MVAWLRGNVLDRYNKKTTRGVASEVEKEDGWPDTTWPDFLGRQHQLQLFLYITW